MLLIEIENTTLLYLGKIVNQVRSTSQGNTETYYLAFGASQHAQCNDSDNKRNIDHNKSEGEDAPLPASNSW